MFCVNTSMQIALDNTINQKIPGFENVDCNEIIWYNRIAKSYQKGIILLQPFVKMFSDIFKDIIYTLNSNFIVQCFSSKTFLNIITFQHVRLAKYFEKLVKEDERFEVIGTVLLGLVCFRLKVLSLTIKILCNPNMQLEYIAVTPVMFHHIYYIALHYFVRIM